MLILETQESTVLEKLKMQHRYRKLCSATLNNSKSKVNTFKFPANSKLRKQWLLKMNRKEFKPDTNSRICAVHFTEDCFRENLAIRRFLVLISSRSESTSKRMLCRLVFFVRKRITGKNASRSTKVPLCVRLLLNEGS